jgi:hypothetical protein
VEFQRCLNVSLVGESDDGVIRRMLEATNGLLEFFQSKVQLEWDDYCDPFNSLSRATDSLRSIIDQSLTSSSMKSKLLKLLQDLSNAEDEEADAEDSQFNENLRSAAAFIKEQGKEDEGVPGKLVARHIGVTSGTLRRHYVPSLKANYAVENDGNGYYIPGPFESESF